MNRNFNRIRFEDVKKPSDEESIFITSNSTHTVKLLRWNILLKCPFMIPYRVH